MLLKHIIGLMTPDRGQMIVDGDDVSQLNEEGLNRLRQKFGMLFQGAALFDSMTVWENVGFGLLQHTKKKKSEVRDIAAQKLKMVGLVGVEDMMHADLSGGMKKRVGLARAIAMELLDKFPVTKKIRINHVLYTLREQYILTPHPEEV